VQNTEKKEANKPLVERFEAFNTVNTRAHH